MVWVCIFAVFIVACAPYAAALGIGTLERTMNYTPGSLSGIKYFVIKGEDERLVVSMGLSGGLAPYGKFRIDNHWYSTRVDKLDVWLQNSFNLTNVSSATLTFSTMYDAEYGWDFGYVEVSVNNGSSWSQLSGTTTTTYRDAFAYVGIPGAPAYTGSLGGWATETVDLSPYAGNLTLVRFHYFTDEYYSENGWFVDDVSVPEIGFYDDFEGQDMGWSTNGWLDNIVIMNDSSAAVPVFIDFTIPSNVSENTTGSVYALKVGGVSGDFNPSQESVPKVIAILPPLFAVLPPPPVDGERGGERGEVQYYSVIGNIINYALEDIKPGVERVLEIRRGDPLVVRIALTISSFVEDARLRITYFDGRPSVVKKDVPNVYKYFEVSTVGIFDSFTESAVIRVAVPRVWVASKGIGPADIVVSRFNMGKWSDLKTSNVDSDRDNYLYDAYSPGFSVFAVRISSPIPEDIVKPAPTKKPDVSRVRPVTLVYGNETPSKVIRQAKEIIMRKTSQSGIIAKEQAIKEEPSGILPFVRSLVLLASISAILLAVALAFSGIKRRFGKERL
jgi:PGF-pre-PGF domain-containing protein